MVSVATDTLWIFFPGPAEVWAARFDHLYQRVNVALFVLLVQRFGNGISKRGAFAQADGTAESCFYRAFVLVYRVEAKNDVAQEKPAEEAQDESWNDHVHGFNSPIIVRVVG